MRAVIVCLSLVASLTGGLVCQTTVPRRPPRIGKLRLAAYNADSDVLGEMTVAQLKDELRSLKLPVSGKKEELRDRLSAATSARATTPTPTTASAATHTATPGAFGDDEPWTVVERQIGRRLPFAIRHSLTSQGVAELRPIQEQAFHPIVQGRDVLGQSLTGTGKTVAYCLPLATCLRPTKRKVRRSDQLSAELP